MPVLSTKPTKTPADQAQQGREQGSRLQILIPIAAAVISLLPFLRRAFTIDDPLFIWMAEQILKHPLNPYGFQVHWGFGYNPMAVVLQNPPLNSYFIAGVIAIGGLRETVLHAAFMLPAAAAAAGTYLIARRFCAHPIEAALAAILTPAFVVCGSSVMCDMLMVAFWVWAVHLWLKGIDENRFGLIVLSSVLIALSALTKYFGVMLIPLLLAYSLVARRRPVWWLLSLLIPAAILVAYNQWTASMYGRGLILDAFGLSGQYREALGAVALPKVVIGLAFAGGCLSTIMFHAPLLWSRRGLGAWMVFAAVLAALFASSAAIGHYELPVENPDRWLLAVHVAVFATAGASILLAAISDLLAARDADSALLFMWLVGTLVFVVFFNWTVNARVLLPMAPAVGIIIMRQIERRTGARPPLFVLPWVLSSLLAVTVAYADYQFANSQRTAAHSVHSDYPAQGRMFFQGHWGFQYYMEQLGAEPLVNGGTRLEIGDVVVIPVNNTMVFPPPEGTAIAQASVPGSKWLSTMSNLRKTGFHADVWGPIPYGFGLAAPEMYYIMPIDEDNLAILDPTR